MSRADLLDSLRINFGSGDDVPVEVLERVDLTNVTGVPPLVVYHSSPAKKAAFREIEPEPWRPTR